MRKSKSKAKAKALNQQNEVQGAMVKGQREATQAILKTERDNGNRRCIMRGGMEVNL
ncbi:MAG: hypothetical protein KME43_26085 [Myxacorys chilensis ATA2-1-KO14]|nr:hypothetical protein [Myxacorys chilensis ATA2-1-KO14]